MSSVHPVSIWVDGVLQTAEVEPRVTLLNFLTDAASAHRALGTGCETNSCGSCTVLVDGESIRSCSVLAVQMAGQSVETVDSAHPRVSRALAEASSARAFQCGYCSAGFVLNAVDLAEWDNRASDGFTAPAGDFCRCTGYRFLREPRGTKGEETGDQERTFCLPRSRHTADTTRGSLEAVFLRSHAAHARLTALDLGRVRQGEGVAAVFTAADLPPALTGIRTGGGDVSPPAYALLAQDKVTAFGEPLALVLADSRAQGEDAADLADATLHALPPVLEPALTSPLVHPDVPDNLAVRRQWSAPGLSAALRADGTRLFTGTYRSERISPSPLECRYGRATWSAETDSLLYDTATQAPAETQRVIAEALGLPEGAVRVRVDEFGGAFGSKHGVQREDLLICWAAMHTGRTVQWVEDRRENIQACGHGRGEQITLTAAVTPTGRITALRAQLTLDLGAHHALPTHNAQLGLPLCVWLPAPYDIEAYGFQYSGWYTNKAPYLTYRAPTAIGAWAREMFFDATARELGLDPLDFRAVNMVRDEDAACSLPYDIRARGFRSPEILGKVRELVQESEGVRRLNDGLRGVGYAFASYAVPGNTDMLSGGSVRYPEKCRITRRADGSIDVETAQVPHGQGHVHTLKSVVAAELGTTTDRVNLIHGDTGRLSISSTGTHGSAFAAFTVGAVRSACARLRETAKKPEGYQSVVVEYDGAPGGFSETAHCCWVRVCQHTGRVTIERYVVVCDAGYILDEEAVRGQIWGSVAQGLGQAGCESLRYDERGRPEAESLADLRFLDQESMPDIEVIYSGRSREDAGYSREAAGQSFGVGEIGCMAAPAAFANALAAILRRDVEAFPITTASVLAALQNAPEGAQ